MITMVTNAWAGSSGLNVYIDYNGYNALDGSSGLGDYNGCHGYNDLSNGFFWAKHIIIRW